MNETGSRSLNDDVILRVEDLRVTFETAHRRVHAVRGTSFELRRGQTLALVGESGSGKSVTAYAILRLIQPPGRITGGAIHFNPKHGETLDLAGLHPKDPRLFAIRGGRIGMIFQEPMTALSPVHSIGNQIIEAIRLHRDVRRREARRIAADMLERVGIADPERRMRQYPFEFSGGMRQRVVIAMALVCRPDILIADEPTTALDVTIQAQILELIEDLKRDFGTSVIFITHDLGVVAQVADQVVVMNKGLIMETSPVMDLFDYPYHPYTRRLLAAMPRIDEGETVGRAGRQDKTEAVFKLIPQGYSLHPPDNDYDSQIDPVLHSVSDTRQVLIWPVQAGVNS